MCFQFLTYVIFTSWTSVINITGTPASVAHPSTRTIVITEAVIVSCEEKSIELKLMFH